MNEYFSRVLLLSAVAWLCACGSGDPRTENQEAPSSPNARPNILLIVADDLGFSDLGAFGGEIDTPNLDSLAFSGVRFTGFYTAPNCSPTRSMLLTGKDNHKVGLGVMGEALPSFPMLQGRPGYEGFLDPNTPTIAEKFSEAGYRTMMTGKWHLGEAPEHQPPQHGFQKSFVLLGGGGDHFGYGQNGEPALEPIQFTEDGLRATYPVGDYSSDFFADQMINYLEETAEDRQPFFAYLAFTAPHWPLQAPKELIAKYEGRYTDGPEALREMRLKQMAELGILDGVIGKSQLPELSAWDELPADRRAVLSRYMEIYAAMVDSLDQNVGKVIEHLKDTGQFENTVVIFMSDNGAEGISLQPLIGRTSNSTLPEHKAEVLAAVAAGNVQMDMMGAKDSFITYGPLWGQVGAAPFRKYKGEPEEGGIRAPAFVSGPGVKGQRVVDATLSVRDIMPTALDLAAISYDQDMTTPNATRNGVNAPTAKSWAPILSGEADAVRGDMDPVVGELFLKRSVRLGSWKAVYSQGPDALPGDRTAPSSWRMYNLAEDPGESSDLRDQFPEEFEALMNAWDLYAEENGVFAPE